MQSLHGAATVTDHHAAHVFQKAELALLRQAQMESFPGEFALMKAQKAIPSNCQLITLAPEYDESSDLIRVVDSAGAIAWVLKFCVQYF